MKNIKIYLIFFIVSSIAFADITPKFGIKNNFSYIDMKETILIFIWVLNILIIIFIFHLSLH